MGTNFTQDNLNTILFNLTTKGGPESKGVIKAINDAIAQGTVATAENARAVDAATASTAKYNSAITESRQNVQAHTTAILANAEAQATAVRSAAQYSSTWSTGGSKLREVTRAQEELTAEVEQGTASGFKYAGMIERMGVRFIIFEGVIRTVQEAWQAFQKSTEASIQASEKAEDGVGTLTKAIDAEKESIEKLNTAQGDFIKADVITKLSQEATAHDISAGAASRHATALMNLQKFWVDLTTGTVPTRQELLQGGVNGQDAPQFGGPVPAGYLSAVEVKLSRLGHSPSSQDISNAINSADQENPNYNVNSDQMNAVGRYETARKDFSVVPSETSSGQYWNSSTNSYVQTRMGGAGPPPSITGMSHAEMLMAGDTNKISVKPSSYALGNVTDAVAALSTYKLAMSGASGTPAYAQEITAKTQGVFGAITSYLSEDGSTQDLQNAGLGYFLKLYLAQKGKTVTAPMSSMYDRWKGYSTPSGMATLRGYVEGTPPAVADDEPIELTDYMATDYGYFQDQARFSANRMGGNIAGTAPRLPNDAIDAATGRIGTAAATMAAQRRLRDHARNARERQQTYEIAGGVLNGGLTGGLETAGGIFGGPLGAILGGDIGRTIGGLFHHSHRDDTGLTAANPLWFRSEQFDRIYNVMTNIEAALLNRGVTNPANGLLQEVAAQRAIPSGGGRSGVKV